MIFLRPRKAPATRSPNLPPPLPAPEVGQVWEGRTGTRRRVTVIELDGRSARCSFGGEPIELAVITELTGRRTLGNYRLVRDADGRNVVYAPGGAYMEELQSQVPG